MFFNHFYLLVIYSVFYESKQLMFVSNFALKMHPLNILVCWRAPPTLDKTVEKSSCKTFGNMPQVRKTEQKPAFFNPCAFKNSLRVNCYFLFRKIKCIVLCRSCLDELTAWGKQLTQDLCCCCPLLFWCPPAFRRRWGWLGDFSANSWTTFPFMSPPAV